MCMSWSWHQQVGVRVQHMHMCMHMCTHIHVHVHMHVNMSCACAHLCTQHTRHAHAPPGTLCIRSPAPHSGGSTPRARATGAPPSTTPQAAETPFETAIWEGHHSPRKLAHTALETLRAAPAWCPAPLSLRCSLHFAGRVAFVSRTDLLTVLDAETGDVIWQIHTTCMLSSPTIHDGTVLVPHATHLASAARVTRVASS